VVDVALSEPDGELVVEPLGVLEAEAPKERVVLGVAVGVGVPLDDDVFVGVTDIDRVVEAVSVLVGDGVDEGVDVAEDVAVTELDCVAGADGVNEADAPSVTLAVGESDIVLDAVMEAVPVPEGVCVPVSLNDGVDEDDSDGAAELVEENETVGVSEAVDPTLWLDEGVGVRVGVKDPVPVGVPVGVLVPDDEEVGVDDRLGVELEVDDTLGDCVAVGEEVLERERVLLGVSPALTTGIDGLLVRDIVTVDVVVGVGVGVDEPVPEAEPVGVCELLGVCVWELDGEPDVLALPLSLPVDDGEAPIVRVVVGV
jgi:hypothetical protein